MQCKQAPLAEDRARGGREGEPMELTKWLARSARFGNAGQEDQGGVSARQDAPITVAGRDRGGS